jgi:MATE family multidrug resistance protein
MLSNITQPLIGIVDTAVVGQLPQAHYIGAVAVASLIFSMVYWGFGSLRMGTGGLAAQAFGAGDMTELRAVFARALIISTIIGMVIFFTGPLISNVSFWLIEASAPVEAEALKYFNIRIWSSPFTLANYVILGWFIGMGKTSTAFVLQLLLNFTNMALDVFFVIGLSMTADGVALGTVLAEIIAAVIGLVLVWRQLNIHGGRWSKKRILRKKALARTLIINGDIMIRSLALTFAFGYFIALSARVSDAVVAANAILMHLLEASAYFLDGFGFAVEALAGQMVGAKSRKGFLKAVELTSMWGAGVALVIAVIFWLAGPLFIDMLTVNEGVRTTAKTYLWWAAAAPVIGIACFQFDGIYTGATRTADMRNMMIISLAVYLVACYLLIPAFGNNGLWASLMVFFIARAVTLGARMPALLRDVF